MYEGMDMGTLWQLKNQPNGDTFRVIGNSLGGGPDGSVELSVMFEVNGEHESRTVAWVRENMQPVI